MLGSRKVRRQMKAVLAVAAEAGAYSVGFGMTRGGLTGFSVYFSDDFSGAQRSFTGAAAFTCAVPHSSQVAASNVHALPTGRAPAAAAAPATPAAARKRGCRAGAKQQLRRHGARGRSTPTAQTARPEAPLEGGVNAALPPGLHTAAHRSTTPPVPPLHNTLPSPHAQLPSALSPLAPSFSPPPLPTPSSTSTPEDEVPLLYDVSLRHLLPHARLSFEEQRWVHYSESGGPFPSHGSSKKRLQPPSPAWGSPSSAVVGCIVNERRARAAVPPPPPTPKLPPSCGR